MHQTRSRTPSESASDNATNRNSQVPGDSPESSHWRPSLRGVSRLLFSSRETLQVPNGREHPKGPRGPKNPSNFGFLKRPFLKVKTKAASQQRDFTPVLAADNTERAYVGKTVEEAGPELASNQPGDAIADLQRPEQKKGSSEHPRPKTGTTARKHAAMDLFRSTRQKKPSSQTEDRQCELQPSTNYVPTHAATDFSRMNIIPKVGAYDPLQEFTQSLNIDAPLTIRPTPHETTPDSTDFQNFLKESRQAAITNTNSRWDKTTALHASHIEDEITPNHYATRREQAMSISHRSTDSKPANRGRARSFVGMVGEYIKPTRSESVYGQSTAYLFHGGDDRSSMRGSVPTGQESSETRWSKVTRPIRRSWSRDRDREANERGTGSWNEAGQKRRSRVMPISPALKKYNRTIRGY